MSRQRTLVPFTSDRRASGIGGERGCCGGMYDVCERERWDCWGELYGREVEWRRSRGGKARGRVGWRTGLDKAEEPVELDELEEVLGLRGWWRRQRSLWGLRPVGVPPSQDQDDGFRGSLWK